MLPLNCEEKNRLPDPRLVQRIRFRKNQIEFDSMWNSDFEWWKIPKVINQIIVLNGNKKIVKKSFILDCSPNVLIDKWTEIEVVCNVDDYEEIKTQIEFLLLDEYHLTEPMHLDVIHSNSNTNFLCLDWKYFFSLDWNWNNFLSFLENFNNPKDDKMEKSEIKEENNEERYYSWNDNNIFRKLLERIKHELVNDFVISGFMPLEELSGNQYLSEKNLKILFDILLIIFKKSKNLFNQDSWISMFYNLIAHIHSNEEIQSICSEYLKALWQEKMIQWANFDRSLYISNIWAYTIWIIKDIYTLWNSNGSFWKKFWNTNDNFTWFKPANKNINFHNNLSRAWFNCKELNEYVDPKTYKRAANEILIWEPEHNWASVWIWPLNYSRIKDDCLDMEKLTGIKMISNWNSIDPESILDNHYLDRIFEFIFGKVNHHLTWNIHNIIVWHIDDLSQTDFENVEKFLQENVLEDMIFDYLSSKFPWEREDDEYLEASSEAEIILNLKIEFFNIALKKLDQNLYFEDRIKKAERIWYKNKDVLEKIRVVDYMEDETRRFFEKKDINGVVGKSKWKVWEALESKL